VPNLPITAFSTSPTSSSFSVLLFKAECHQNVNFNKNTFQVRRTGGIYTCKKRSLVSTNSGGGLVSSTTIYFYRTYYTCRLRSNIAPKPQLSRKIPSIHHYQNNKNYNTSYKNPAKIFLQGQQKPSGCGTLPGTQSTYIAGKKYLTRKNPARKRPIH
jgi:hypothetical protein